MARKLVDLTGIARLLGVSVTTPPQWRQRSRRGELDPPLPDPLPEFPDKPIWPEDEIISWAIRTNRWPAGTAARMLARGKRRREAA